MAGAHKLQTLVPIGEFSRLTHLSVKSLRHYHELGLLVPSDIDDFTGYRRYATDQVSPALLIGRLRALQMPLPDVRRVLDAGSATVRNEVIAEHLRRMEQELERTQTIVRSLRHLIEPPSSVPRAFTHEWLPRQTAFGLREVVSREDIQQWCPAAFATIYPALARANVRPAGPGSATYDEEFFTESQGTVTVFVPVDAQAPAVGGLRRMDIASGRHALTTHHGAYIDVDRAYAALGAHVAEHDRVAPGPVREIYLASPPEVSDEADFRTVVCWPITA